MLPRGYVGPVIIKNMVFARPLTDRHRVLRERYDALENAKLYIALAILKQICVRK
jgi:hypothetical protein